MVYADPSRPHGPHEYARRSGGARPIRRPPHRGISLECTVVYEMQGRCRQRAAARAADGLLPGEVLYRRKSPYPKTYDPAYENLLRTAIIETLSDTRAPLRELIDMGKVLDYISQPSDYGRPFYGQLMAGPQLLAYLLQVNYWLKKYDVALLL